MIKSAPLPLSAHSIADLLCTLIILCRGRDVENKPIWAYLCIKPSMASAFKYARERGGLDIADYGTIIESGDGEEPPSDIKTRMERDYGVNHGFEDQLLAAIAAKQESQANA